MQGATAGSQPAAKRKRFDTVAFASPVANRTPAAKPASAAPSPEPDRREPTASSPLSEPRSTTAEGGPPTAAATGSDAPAATPTAAGAGPAAAPAPRERRATPVPEGLELLLERNAEPTGENPLRYRERAYLIHRGMTVPEAEAALRWRLAEVQQEMKDAPPGCFVNFAAFDHRWSDRPNRPPLVVLQWRDWRGEISVDYPAAERASATSPEPEEDERLAEAFEELQDLPHLGSAAEALGLGIGLLGRLLPTEAASAAIYDINSDEMRFVVVTGPGAEALKGQAIARAAGLLGQATRAEAQASVFADVMIEPNYNPDVDSRAGLDPRNMLLRPLVHDGHLVGILQLINRAQEAAFSGQDVNLINYVSAQLAQFIHAKRMRSHTPPAGIRTR